MGGILLLILLQVVIGAAAIGCCNCKYETAVGQLFGIFMTFICIILFILSPIIVGLIL